MRNAPPTDRAAGAEECARAECEALLARLRAAGAGEPRLERVRHAIARGEFQVNARVVAERLIARFLAS